MARKRTTNAGSSLLVEATVYGLEHQIELIQNLIDGLRKGKAPTSAGGRPTKKTVKRVLSPEARARIAAAQKRRWAAFRKAKKSKEPAAE